MTAVIVVVVVLAVAAGGTALWVSSRRRATERGADRQLVNAELSVLAEDVMALEPEVVTHPEARVDYDAAVSRYRAAQAALEYADDDAERRRVETMVAEATYSMSRARAIVEGRPPPPPPPPPAPPAPAPNPAQSQPTVIVRGGRGGMRRGRPGFRLPGLRLPGMRRRRRRW